MLRKQNEKKEQEKDVAYYIQNIEDHCKLMLIGKKLIVVRDDNVSGNIEVCSTDL